MTLNELINRFDEDFGDIFGVDVCPDCGGVTCECEEV